MKPPFRVGDKFALSAVDVRVVAGRHGNGDQVLEIRTPGGAWAKVPMALGALQTDFYDQNEPKRYRFSGEQQGRTMYPAMLNSAVFDGWQTAVGHWLDPYRRFDK